MIYVFLDELGTYIYSITIRIQTFVVVYGSETSTKRINFNCLSHFQLEKKPVDIA